MGEARPKRFGECSPIERAIINDILFLRDVKQRSFQKIADELNCQHRLPRRASKWNWILLRHVYECNRKPPGIKEACS